MTVEILNGARAGRRVRIGDHQRCRVGRSERADFQVPDDPHLSGVHLLLETGRSLCLLRDLDSTNGTAVNGDFVSEAQLSEGDEIMAGSTRLRVSQIRQGELPQTVFPALERELPLFAVLDAARSPLIMQQVLDSGAEHRILYQGDPSGGIAQFAPYLVSLPRNSTLLNTLVKDGWGEAWGVFLTSDGDMDDVMKHLQQFLVVETEAGKRLYFRFYDPAVLRVFLPVCSSFQTRELFGVVKSFLMESPDATELWKFSSTMLGVKREAIRFGETARPSGSQLPAARRIVPDYTSTLQPSAVTERRLPPGLYWGRRPSRIVN